MVISMADDTRQSNTQDLVVLARTEAGALAELYEMTYDRVFRFCVVRIGDRTQAEDIVSEVYLDVARQIHRFRGTTEQDFRNWLFAIAANKANSFLRRYLRRTHLLQCSADRLARPIPDCPGTYPGLDWPVLHQAILELRPVHQTIVALRFFEDMDFESIGRIVGMRPNAVRVALHRILKRLRRRLGAGGEGGNSHV